MLTNHFCRENGIGTTETQEKTTKELAFNRIEVLRLLLVLISKRLYRSSEVASHTLTYLTCVANKQLILVFLYSLINTVSFGLKFTFFCCTTNLVFRLCDLDLIAGRLRIQL